MPNKVNADGRVPTEVHESAHRRSDDDKDYTVNFDQLGAIITTRWFDVEGGTELLQLAGSVQSSGVPSTIRVSITAVQKQALAGANADDAVRYYRTIETDTPDPTVLVVGDYVVLAG